MAIKEKIQQAINSLTAEEIDDVTTDDLAHLSNKQIEAYIVQACNLKRNYFLHMIVDNGDPDSERRRFGRFVAWVEFNERENKWELMCGAGLIPGYYQFPPLMVTEEKFIAEARKKGIPEQMIQDIVTGKPIIS